MKNSLARAAVLSLIEYFEQRAKDVPGPERMKRLLATMEARGMPVDEDLAEALFQRWQRERKAEQAAATAEPALVSGDALNSDCAKSLATGTYVAAPDATMEVAQ